MLVAAQTMDDSDDEQQRRRDEQYREMVEREKLERRGELNKWKVRTYRRDAESSSSGRYAHTGRDGESSTSGRYAHTGETRRAQQVEGTCGSDRERPISKVKHAPGQRIRMCDLVIIQLASVHWRTTFVLLRWRKSWRKRRTRK